MDHKQLVSVAEQWLIRKGCTVTLHEYHAPYVREQPDAIGWKCGMSIVVECKTSENDFLADKKKSFRRKPFKGMGEWRFYLVPSHLKGVRALLPDGWGLLTVSDSGRVLAVAGMPSKNSRWKSEAPFRTCCNKKAESLLLLSVARRMQIRGHLQEVYSGRPK
jgi:hypothetical protein